MKNFIISLLTVLLVFATSCNEMDQYPHNAVILLMYAPEVPAFSADFRSIVCPPYNSDLSVISPV